ncbi:MAG: tyrosine--tRNA ligase [Pyrinomonadaceae bacterium]
MSNSTNVFDDFMWRGMIYDATEGLQTALAKESVTAYIGFDPSAPSLHVGSLLPIMSLARLQRHGHRPIAIVGGGTGLIGDPSGKVNERQLLTKEQVEHNLQKIKEQLSHFLDFDAKDNPALIINNADWLTSIPLIDFLRDVGKNFSINSMLSRESVKRRMEQGITYTEFSYMLLQAYDFLVLNERHGCTLQMGGSDQWGNILAGVDLIRRVRGEQGARAYGLVLPLLMDPKGVKFGKTESGSVWLNADPSLPKHYTTPYSFYQYFLNSDDASVIAHLKYFTWLSEEEIAEYESAVASEPQKREAQRRLAREVTRMLHGDEALANAERATRAIFGGEAAGADDADIGEAFGYVPSTPLDSERLGGEGMSVVDLVFESGLATMTEGDKQVPSKAQAKRLIQSGGIYLNYKRVADVSMRVRPEDAIGGGRFLLLSRGEKQYHLFRVDGD